MNLNLKNAIQEAKNLYGGAKTVLEYKHAALKIKTLYEQFQESEDMVIQYLKVLSVLCWKEEYECDETMEEAKRVYDNHQSSENIALEYLTHLVNQCSTKKLESELNIIAKEAKQVYKHHQNSEDVTIEYLKFLFQLSEKQVEESVIRKIAADAKFVYNLKQSSVDAAINYIKIYNSFIFLQIEAAEFDEIVMELKRVYEQHKSSEDVTKKYISALSILSWTQIEESPIMYLSDEMGRVYNQNHPSEFVASEYLVILLKLLKKQEEVNQIKDTIQKISDVLQKHIRLTYIVEDTIDSSIFSDDVKENDIVKFVNVLISFYKQDVTASLLSQTKYSFMFDPFKKLSDEDLKKLIEIFCLVQKIKKQLVIKNPSEVMFGHYTSAKVLQLLLKQKEEKEKYSIESRSRLSNVNYMNDPSEGKVLDQFLQMDSTFQQLSLKPIPWFLMSLTTAIDKLSMWSQYGDRAEGVCLVLNSDDFSKVVFSSDIEWLTISKNSNNDEEEDISRETTKIKDFIYRIGYLSTQSDVDAVLKPEYNTCLDEEEIEVINNSLLTLKEKVEGKDKVKESILYEKVDECLEEIRYLFKSADYSYEYELRVLKYMPLEPDNPKIKIDDKGEYAKLYIERDNPIQISEVIFGPKFQNPENVTPLLYLLDKNIKFRQSEISFR